MKLVVSGGGTGGHVYPALTVVKLLLEDRPMGAMLPTLAPADVLWLGSRGGLEEEFVRREGIEFAGLAAGGLRGVGLPNKIRNSARIVGSVSRARSILRLFRPDAILFVIITGLRLKILNGK